MDFKTGHFEADGNAVHVDCGWVPDTLIVIFDDPDNAAYTATRIDFWSQEVWAAGVVLDGMYGWTRVHGNAQPNLAAHANTDGFIPYDSNANFVRVMSPIPARGEEPTTCVPWTASTVWVARTATIVGSIIRPTVRNGYVYECTTYNAATGTPEPTWPTTPGLTVAEAVSANVWTCREEKVCRDGAKGFTLQAGSSTDNEWAIFMAFRTDKSKYLGDADEGNLHII